MSAPFFIAIVCLIIAALSAVFALDIVAIAALANTFLWLAVGYLEHVIRND